MQHLINRWRATWNPSMYHGWGKQRHFFEGWYFKLVDPTEQYAFAVIPGISMDAQGGQHAFIQLLDGKRCTSTYLDFKAEDFQPDNRNFALRLGENFFSEERIVLQLPQLKGELRLSKTVPWPKMLGAPGIMGWYSFVPFMECYHGVVSLDHQLDGELEVYGQPTGFTGGRGYIEKDWGQSFPSSWIWMQSNHFGGSSPVSLTASVANIPWLRSYFIGYIVGFLLGKKLYRFATYTGAQMKASVAGNQVFLSFRDRRNRLEIVAHRNDGGGGLISPLSGAMAGKVNESLQAEVAVKLFEGEQLLYEGTGRNTGLELAGPVEELLTDKWRR